MSGTQGRRVSVDLRLGGCPVGVDTALWSAIDAAVIGKSEPLAVFDADGTLWADDLGETHLRVLADKGLVTPSEGHATLIDEYAYRCDVDVHDAYAWGARILAGMDHDALIESAHETWRRHRLRLLPPMAKIVEKLISAGVDVVVVSASNRWIIEAAVAELGVPPDRVIAVDLESDGGILSARVVQPMPNGVGKVEAIEARLGRRPVLAFGNSVHDVPMLHSADVGVCVLATHPGQQALNEALEATRASSGWHYLPVPHPVM